MTAANIILGVLILTAMAFAIRSMIRDKKKGKLCSCGGDCSKCCDCQHHV